MIRMAIACAGILALAACSTAPSSDSIEAKIIAACAVKQVAVQLPHICADPARYAQDAETAAQIVQALRDGGW